MVQWMAAACAMRRVCTDCARKSSPSNKTNKKPKASIASIATLELLRWTQEQVSSVWGSVVATVVAPTMSDTDSKAEDEKQVMANGDAANESEAESEGEAKSEELAESEAGTATVPTAPRSLARKSGYLTSLSVQQAAALVELEARVQASEFRADVYEVLEDEPRRFLLRFLRATMKSKSSKRIFVVQAAYKRLCDTLQWRRDRGFNVPFNEIARPEKYDDPYLLVRPGHFWVDHTSGTLLSIDKFGFLGNYLRASSLEPGEWVSCIGFQAETNMALLRQTELREYDVIVDMRGLGRGIFGRIAIVKLLNSVFSTHYPEMIRTIRVVNAGFWFERLWTLIVNSRMLDADFASKVSVSKRVPKEQFAKEFDEALLPVEYGGRNAVAVPLTRDAPAKFHEESERLAQL